MYCKKIILFISKRLPYIFSHFPYYSYFFLLKSAILIIVITNYHNNTASLCRPKRFSNQERRSPMTLREIAAEAGVSISTVSRVINQNH
ncbi:MAG: LacI family DNA-binding transcriptional regulator [Blautia obeum]